MIHLRDQDVITAVCFYLIILFMSSITTFIFGWCLGRKKWKKIVDDFYEGYP